MHHWQDLQLAGSWPIEPSRQPGVLLGVGHFLAGLGGRHSDCRPRSEQLHDPFMGHRPSCRDRCPVHHHRGYA